MERQIGPKVKKIVIIGVMAALVCAASSARILLPSSDGKAAIHLGNIACLLSGLLFGGLSGGLSAGIGSAFYDVFNPLYIKDAPITFINKFVMGFTAGLLCARLKIKNIYLRAFISAFCGQTAYIILYLAKSYISDRFIVRHAAETVISNLVIKGTASCINGLISVVCAVILYSAIREVLNKTPIGIVK